MTSDKHVDQLLRNTAKAAAPMDEEHAAALWGAMLERRRRRSIRRGRATMATAAAACLIIGFGAGRWTHAGLPNLPTTDATEATAVMTGDRPELLRLMREGLPLLREVERNPAEARLSGVEEILWLTRRLRDARPGHDPGVDLLLSDLELILVQLLDSGRDTATVERALAGDAVIARAIVPRMEQLDVSLGVQ
jgi:hypothetical protein